LARLQKIHFNVARPILLRVKTACPLSPSNLCVTKLVSPSNRWRHPLLRELGLLEWFYLVRHAARWPVVWWRHEYRIIGSAFLRSGGFIRAGVKDRRGGLVRRTILIPICNAKRPAIQISNYICNSPQSYSGRRSNSSSNICNSFTDTSQVGYPKSPTIFQKSPKILLYTQLFSHFVTQKSLPSARPASRVQQYRRTCLVELPTWRCRTVGCVWRHFQQERHR